MINAIYFITSIVAIWITLLIIFEGIERMIKVNHTCKMTNKIMGDDKKNATND